MGRSRDASVAQVLYDTCDTLSPVEEVDVATQATSFRMDPDLKDRLARRAGAERITERALLEQLLGEGLAMLEHPGIVFRAGPTGRRAALAVGPDVWEVISALRYTEGPDEQRVGALAEQFDLHPGHLRTAIDYAAAHRAEIDAQVAANDAAALDAEEIARQRADLMAS